MLKQILFFILGLAAFPANAQTCFQTFLVESDRVLEAGNLDVILQDLTGRRCDSVEAERSAIYINQLSSISEKTFSDYKKWASARTDLSIKLSDLRNQFEKARTDGADAETWNTLKVLAINTTGAAITIAGCVGTPFIGISAYLCVGGLSLTGVGAYDGLSGNDFQGRAQEIEGFIKEIEDVLEKQDILGAAILDNAKQAYLQRFEALCSVIQSECQ